MKSLFLFLTGILACPLVWADDFQLRSTAFENNTAIPSKYTCDGADINPPLTLSNVPAQAQTLALTVSDPDAPNGVWSHWIVYNIPPDTREIDENSDPGVQGLNDFGKDAYGGPCPPPGTPHHYIFHVYALDTFLNAQARQTLQSVEEAAHGHIIKEARLVGTYQK